jgi:Cadherin-like
MAWTSSATVTLIFFTSVCAAAELFYSIDEELEIGYEIADVVQDAKLESIYGPEAVRSLRFALLSPPAVNISVVENSGKIVTTGRIDREAICGGPEVSSAPSSLTPPCRVRLDVAVHPVQYFRTVKIVVDIADVNDNDPEFRPAQIVRQISESAPTGSGFVVPTAHDADSSRFSVDRYELSDVDGQRYDGPFGLRISKKLDGSTEVSIG